MSDKIEPALSAEEWSTPRHALNISAKMAVFASAELFEGTLEISTPNQILEGWDGRRLMLRDPTDIAALIALANAALPDSDLRKITRAWVRALRNAALKLETMTMDDGPPWAHQQANELRRMSDALESYLPPA